MRPWFVPGPACAHWTVPYEAPGTQGTLAKKRQFFARNSGVTGLSVSAISTCARHQRFRFYNKDHAFALYL